MPCIVPPGHVRRAIVVVLDGLRPDAIERYRLENMLRLARNGAATFTAQTVAPSVTAAAMATLFTGASPSRHGLDSSRLRIPRSRGSLHPLPKELARRGLPTSVFMHRIPWLVTGFARRAAECLGVGDARFGGRICLEILVNAQETLRRRDGLLVLHFPDADHAGHAHGWMSPEYEAAARRLDIALAVLMQIVDLSDPGTLLVALADHGGGGWWPRDHDSDHPLDRTIPVILAGGAVPQGVALGDDVRIEDVPATICDAFGIPIPESYAGRVLQEQVRASLSAA